MVLLPKIIPCIYCINQLKFSKISFFNQFSKIDFLNRYYTEFQNFVKQSKVDNLPRYQKQEFLMISGQEIN